MKFKSLLSLSLIFSITLITSGFINPNPASLPEPKAEDWAFAEFLSHFEKVDNTFAVSLGDLSKYEALKKSKKAVKGKQSKTGLSSISLLKYLPELESRMYSRMGPPEVLPVARFYPNEATIAVIYMTYQPFRLAKDMEFHLALFDLKGNNLPHQKKEDEQYQSAFNLAVVNQKVTQTFSFNKEGFLWKNSYNNLRKLDIKKKGILGNDIVGYDLTNTEVFQIKENGKIETTKEYPVTSKASLD